MQGSGDQFEAGAPVLFDLRDILRRAMQLRSRLSGISITLPFVSIEVDPGDREREVAEELVTRLADKRVLNACECCDQCIERALHSLQEIRALLVQAEVDLAKVPDSGVHLVVEAMLAVLRQFLTFTEARSGGQWEFGDSPLTGVTIDGRHPDNRDYFVALEALRGHLHRCTRQLAEVAGVTLPATDMWVKYDTEWETQIYRPLEE